MVINADFVRLYVVCGGTCHLGETERKTREREQNKSTPFSLLSSLFSLVFLPCDICISRDRTRVPVVTTANRPLKIYLSRPLYPYDGDTNDLSSLISVSALSLSLEAISSQIPN
ncbi:hypothetical protein F2Q69_00060461 [Brassica cretica]|uniref:Uncharacterized protein n=1 Tax=Brassica cretica TaxID=69181 RepID=A0A8S9RQV5_BRACR|nr:hypothetical protein F2Q69_00060461 [Brassica cretica]